MTQRPLYPHDLLGLAYRLAGRGSGPGRPRVIELRRAVSSAYYALFHGLTWTVATELLGAQDHPSVPVVCRWINHTDVLLLVRSVLIRSHPEQFPRGAAGGGRHIEPLLPNPIDPRLVDLCKTFNDLQEQRHGADYDDLYEISKPAAIRHVRRAEEAVRSLYALYEEREPGLVLLTRLALGGVRIAKTR